MSFFSFIPEELHATEGLEPELKVVYWEVIVPNRNRRTGISQGRLPGALYSLTYPGIRRCLRVHGYQGVAEKEYSKPYAQRVVERLVKAGLIAKNGSRVDSDGLVCLIFNKYKHLHFSAQKNVDTKSIPQPDTKPIPSNPDFSVSYDASTVNPDTLKVQNVDTLTEGTEVRAATTTAREPWRDDPIAAAMLAGGMQEYHVMTGMHLIGRWRQQANFSDEAMVLLIKARLAQNKNITTVKYFNAMAADVCRQAGRNVVPFKQKPGKPASDSAGSNHASALQPSDPDSCSWL